ncbi:hypothetical protein [Sodalis ligni]|uniref:hypothetical protein n=1 Tax=Sodalis ligni TaxID=2697027 RepID=UPI003B848379
MNKNFNFIWLHLGASAFHRAHQCWYINKLKAEENKNYEWSISLANIRNSEFTQSILQHLFHQKGLYTLEMISPNGVFEYKIINCIDNVILWDEGLKIQF